MNIKFNDAILFERLRQASVAMMPVGSRAYGLETDRSDYDWLYVYPTSKEELRSPFRNHHQFQYVDAKGNDHLFVSLHSFVANLVKGDSLLNFEALFTDEFKTSYLAPLIKQRSMFYTVSIVRAYLGKAKKDFKAYEKHAPWGQNHVITAREKKLVHLMRSIHFAAAILDGNFALDGGVARDMWLKVKAANPMDQEKYARNFNAQVEYLRDKINQNQQFIPNYLRIEDQQYLDNTIRAITKDPGYREKRKLLKGFDMTPFYESNETGLIYEK